MSESGGLPLLPKLGLFLGPLAAIAIYFLLPPPQLDSAGLTISGLSHAGRMTLAIGAWLAVWWISEAIPIEAAALLPLVAFPLAGVTNMKSAAAPYADEVVFLFLGGMMIGAALERWGLHRRVALLTMLALGTRPAMLIAGLLAATALLSMWVSNTAAAVMMLPIANGVVNLVHARNDSGPHPHPKQAKNFAVAAMLAVAYGASIGGVATLVGTPPNGVLAAFMRQSFSDSLTFGEYLKIGLPTALLVLPVAWALLLLLHPMRGLHAEGAHHLLRADLRALGPVSRGEWTVLLVFAFASFLWIFREPVAMALHLFRDRPGAPPGAKPEILLTDAGIAIGAALLLFLIPVHAKQRVFALDWKTVGALPWGILLLFGGGLSLAAAIEANRVDVFLASAFNALQGLHPFVLLLITAALAVFASEIGSNTAVATVLLPIVATAAPALGIRPELLCFAVSFGVSLAFMMPSGTPPNALAFTSGHLRVPDMARAGLALNLASIAIIAAVVYWIAPSIAVHK
jgi:sodium-dependent dicarboxylate transporter 2/3/5